MQIFNNIKGNIVSDIMPDPSPFEVESAIVKLKRYKSPGSDQIPTELFRADSKIQRFTRKNVSIIVSVLKKGNKTD
jgi:hypothetical protein